MNKVFHLLSVALFATLTFSVAACSDDDSSNGQSNSQLHYNSLEYLQGHIVAVDSKGDLVAHINGVPLTEFSSDTTVVYIGVKDIAEAKETFQDWLPDGIYSLTDGNNIVASLTDTLGNAQGEVHFAPNTTTSDRNIASVSFSKGATIPHVTRVEFISENAWPHNSQSPYAVGDTIMADIQSYNGEDGPAITLNRPFVCIREAEYGKSGIFISISPEKIYGYNLINGNDNNALGKEAAYVIKTDFNQYATLMNNMGMPQMKNEPKQSYFFEHYKAFWKFYTINLNDGVVNWAAQGQEYRYVLYCIAFDENGKLTRP